MGDFWPPGNKTDRAGAGDGGQCPPPSEPVAADTAGYHRYPKAGDTVLVTAQLANSGMLPYMDGASVAFTVGAETVTGTYDSPIPGGGSAAVGAYLTVPEDLTQLTFTASLNGGQSEGSCTLTPEAVLEITDSEISSRAAQGYAQASSGYTALIANSGSAEAGEVVFTASSGEAVLASASVSGLAPGEVRTVELPFAVPDSLYTLTGNIGSAPVRVSAVSGGETVFTFDGFAAKEYDADAVEYLSDASAANGSSFVMKPGEEKNLQPAITGSFAGELKVEWQSSSDTDVVYTPTTEITQEIKDRI